MNPIELNAIRLLELMVESGDEMDLFENTWLQDKSKLSARDIDDAVDYLENIGAIDVFKYIGTAPFNFGNVELKSRGRYLYHEIKDKQEDNKAKEQKLNTHLPARSLNPIGSPYGFTEDDWVTVALQKENKQTLYVAIGMQFESEHYKSEIIIQSIKNKFQDIVQQFNQKHQEDKIELYFVQLSAGYGEHLFNEIARSIIGADIAIFETSDLNPNVMLEMGVALTWGISVLPIKEKGTQKPPSDISGQTWIEYEESGTRIEDKEFDKKILKMIERIIAKKGKNP